MWRVCALAGALIACKRESPKPAPAPSTSAAVVPTPAFVQLRHRDSSLGDPTTTNVRMAFDLAVGAAGKLRVELVDRVDSTHACDASNPRCVLLADVELKPPRAAIELSFASKDGQVAVLASIDAAGKRTESTKTVPPSFEPAAGAKVKAAVVDRPAMLPTAIPVPIAGLSWGSAEPFVVSEVASEPHWLVRVQFGKE